MAGYVSGWQCRLYLCDPGVLAALPGDDTDFVELKLVNSVEVGGPFDKTEVADRSKGRKKSYIHGKEDFTITAELNIKADDPAFQMLHDAYRATPGSGSEIIGVLCSVGDPNASGTVIDYAEMIVIDMPRSEGNSDLVSGTVEFAVAANSTLVPVHGRTSTTNSVFTSA